MSFEIDNFSPIGGQARRGNSPAEWSYSSLIDDLATVLAPGYFDEVGTQVSAGDFINVSLLVGKAIITVLSTTLKPPGVVIDSDIIGGGQATFPVEIFTGTLKNLVVADNLKFIVMDNAAAQIVAIPENVTEPFPIGAEIEFLREGVGTVAFATGGSVVLQSRLGLVNINARYSAAALKKIDTDEWRLFGDLA